MEFDEVDTQYKKWCDDARDSLLARLHAGGDKNSLEAEYISRLREFRKKYTALYTRVIQSKKPIAHGRKNVAFVHTKPFEVHGVRLKPSLSERLVSSFELFLFHFFIFFRHIRRFLVTAHLSYSYYRFRVFCRSLFISFMSFLKGIMSTISRFFIRLWKKISLAGLAVYGYIIWLYGLLPRFKKKAPAEGEKKNEGSVGGDEKKEAPA